MGYIASLKRRWATVLVMLSLFGLASASPACAKELMLTVKLANKEDVPFFNRVLYKEDIVATYGLKQGLLRHIHGPMIMVSRSSIRQLEEELSRRGGLEVAYVNYNPEHWKKSHTPRSELDHLLASVKRARALAQRHAAKLAFITDHVLLKQYGSRIAPMVDLFGIQLQRFQGEASAELRRQAASLAAIVRKGSRTVPIFFQLSLAPPRWEIVHSRKGIRKRLKRDETGKKMSRALHAEEVLAQIRAIQDLTDGIGLIYTEETRGEMRRLVGMLRN